MTTDKPAFDGTGYIEEPIEDIWQAFERIINSFKQRQLVEDQERDFEEWSNYWGE